MGNINDIKEIKNKIRITESKIKNSTNPAEQRQLRALVGKLNKELNSLTSTN